MGILILGMIVIGTFVLLFTNFRLLLGIIGCLIGLGLAWVVGWGVIIGLFAAMA